MLGNGALLTGPISYFHEQLQLVGWTPLPDALILDHYGIAWSVQCNNFSDIEPSLQDAWVHYITPKVRNDLQFQGLQPFQVQACRKSLGDRKQYNTCRANYSVGAILSSGAKAKFLSDDKAACHLCKLPGGAEHILLQCSGTQQFRDKLDLSRLLGLPNAVRVSGLFPIPVQLSLHIQMLGSLPDEPRAPIIEGYVNFFTDGSTMHGNNRSIAISAWSLMWAFPHSLEVTCASAGVLPGVVQTNNRAELYAVWQALVSAEAGSIYTDSQYCFDGVHKLQVEGWNEISWSASSNYGLWKRVWDELRPDPSRWSVIKGGKSQTVSHRQPEQATSFYDFWCIKHDAAADARAKAANHDRSEAFKQNHRTLVQVLETQCQLRDTLSKLQDEVPYFSRSNLAVDRGANTGIAEDIMLSQQERLGMMRHDNWCGFPNAQHAFPTSGFLMHAPFALLLWQFLVKQRWTPDTTG